MKLAALVSRFKRNHYGHISTAGWKMPPFPPTLTVELKVISPEQMFLELNRRGIGSHKTGFCEWQELENGHRRAVVHVLPLETVEDFESLRHEVRHAVEGHWHGTP